MKKNTPGRPRLDPADKTVPISSGLPSRQYDQLWERAKAARVSIAEQLRRDVRAASTRKKY